MATIKNTITLDDKMTPVFNKMLKTMNSVMKAMEQTDKTSTQAFESAIKDIQAAERELMQFSNTAMEAADSVAAIGDESSRIQTGKTGIAGFWDTLQSVSTGIAGTIYATGQIADMARKVVEASDSLTLMDARLGLITDDVENLENKIYRTAQSSRGNFKNMAANVSQLALQAGDAFNNSEDEILKFTDTLNKMFLISGTDSQAISSVMYNLTQSLSSGRLLGQDYRILLQNAPKFREALKEYYGVSASELQKMVTDGKVSATDVKLAIFDAADDINEKFNKIPMTFAQAFDQIRNTVSLNAVALNKKLTMVLNSRLVQTLIRDANRFITIISKISNAVLDVIALTLDGLADIEPVLWIMTRTIEILALLLYVKLTMAVVSFAAKAVSAMYDYIASLVTAKITTDGLIVSTNLLLTGIVLAVAALVYVFKEIGEQLTGTQKTTNDVIGAVIAAITYLGVFLYDIVAAIVNVILGAIKIIISAIKGIRVVFEEVLLGCAKLVDRFFGTNIAGAMAGVVSQEIEGIKSLWGEGTWLKWKNPDTSAYEARNNYLNSIQGDLNYLTDKGIDVSSVGGTVNTKGEMSITEEDLKLLKDVAATEFVNRYTTLRPTLTANFGDIRETADVNVIAAKIGDLMEQALTESLY